MSRKTWTLQLAGRELTVETGFLAPQASGSAVVEYGDTRVLATAVMSASAGQSRGYFPLVVDYEERYYAAGKIKGSRFIKREGRPSDDAILTGRMVDRTIRPLFPARMRNEVQVIVTVLSIDQENDPDIVSIIAASSALALSDIPWNGPVAAVRVGRIDGKIVINPTNAERIESDCDLLVAGTQDHINMIEASGREVAEDDVIAACGDAHHAIQKITTLIAQIREEAGKVKAMPALLTGPAGFEDDVRTFLVENDLAGALYSGSKERVGTQVDLIMTRLHERVIARYPREEQPLLKEVAQVIMDEVADAIVHERIVREGVRPDGRTAHDIRPLISEVGLLPRTHGSGLFQRGETQVLTVTTLGSPGDQQVIDTMETDTKKRYIHHYNFPPYSVGEVRMMRGPGRREVGHGALAEKAIVPILPSIEEFPYTILLVSEVLSSNGSSSMASTCGSTLSLMDAGVPIKRPVAGIAMGVMTEENGNHVVLTDIQGAEDHYGDMDFKVAGTTEGITALQMDVKIAGVDLGILKEALQAARIARLKILETMTATIAAPRPNLSPYAPRIVTITINPDKIRDVIGPGGKMINQIIDQTGVAIDIEDDGRVMITSTDEISAQKAVEWVRNLTREVRAGELFNGRITRIMAFGAFAEILPGQEGLIHISELSQQRVARVEDVVSVGDVVPVKVKEIDRQGRINLSLKDAAPHHAPVHSRAA